MEIFLSRREASAYLRKNYGHLGLVSASYLAKLAVSGGGPVFHRCGQRVGYKQSDLDTWFIQRASAPLQNTTQGG